MIDLDRKVQPADRFFSPTGKRFETRFNASTLRYLRDEQGLFLYVVPTFTAPATQKAGELVFFEDHCTHTVADKTDDELWQAFRSKRILLLSESDWTEFAPMSVELKAAWQAYRQELRDIPQTVLDPRTITIPTQPSEG